MRYDVVLLHPPSIYDFRKRDDILFAYLSNSDSVHVSPIFEIPPVGLVAIRDHLTTLGLRVAFLNLASYMLKHEEFDSDDLLKKLDTKFLGVDLHWLIHAQGGLEIAKIFKSYHPDTKIFMGGLSVTHYAQEAIQYPQIDYVIRGDDTLKQTEQLVLSENNPMNLSQIDGLVWKYGDQVNFNEYGSCPKNYSATVNWNRIFKNKKKSATYHSIVIPQYGCEYSCNWCGGSRDYFRNYRNIAKPIRKIPEVLKEELTSIICSETKGHNVTMINYWHEYDEYLDAVTDVFSNDNVQTVHLSMRRIPKVERIKSQPWSKKMILEFSPDSFDMAICKKCGHGYYSMDELEAFIDEVIDDVYSIEIYFMIGTPDQTKESVFNSVHYCDRILAKYKGKHVMTYMCPMLPFLDPGSTFYQHPEKYGYKIFYKTLEEHRRAIESMNWKNRLNYETDCMSRDDLVIVTYEAIAELTKVKVRNGFLPEGIARNIQKLINETIAMIDKIELVNGIPEGSEKEEQMQQLKSEINKYNKKQFSTIRSQQRPIDFGLSSSQWYDTECEIESIILDKEEA